MGSFHLHNNGKPEDPTENSEEPEFSENCVDMKKITVDLVFLPVDCHSTALPWKLTSYLSLFL